MRIRSLAMGLLLSGVAFAAEKKVETPDLMTRIANGFSSIVGGDFGLQLAVLIIFVAGFALGWWKEAHGGF